MPKSPWLCVCSTYIYTAGFDLLLWTRWLAKCSRKHWQTSSTAERRLSSGARRYAIHCRLTSKVWWQCFNECALQFFTLFRTGVESLQVCCASCHRRTSRRGCQVGRPLHYMHRQRYMSNSDIAFMSHILLKSSHLQDGLPMFLGFWQWQLCPRSLHECMWPPTLICNTATLLIIWFWIQDSLFCVGAVFGVYYYWVCNNYMYDIALVTIKINLLHLRSLSHSFSFVYWLHK